MPRTLDVYLHETNVGTLMQGDDGRLQFLYNIQNPDVYSISVGMPLREEPYGHKECHAFFGGLLPEEGERQKLAEALKVSEKNDFRLLEVIGRECAGAISIFPAGEHPEFSGKEHDLECAPPKRKIERAELRLLLERLRTSPAMVQEGVRLSLAGAQKKVALMMIEDDIYIPDRHHLSTHIFKPPHDRYPHTVENELFCMRMAASIWQENNSYRTSLIKIDEEYSVFVTERFDRIEEWLNFDEPQKTKHYLRRRHQEDFCQALNISPEMKYQSEGGPSFAQCFSLIDNASKNAAADRKRFLEMACFNYLIGNLDAHAKNFSLIHGINGLNEMCNLSPAYDILCVDAYESDPKNARLAMKIGGHYEVEDLYARHWEKFATECGLGAPYVLKTLKSIAQKMDDLFPRVTNALKDEGITSPVFEKIEELFYQKKDRVMTY